MENGQSRLGNIDLTECPQQGEGQEDANRETQVSEHQPKIEERQH